MSAYSSQEREIREILIAANSGEATPEQFARLDALLCSDPYLANYSARLLEQQAALAWQGGRGKSFGRGAAEPSATPAASDRQNLPLTTIAKLWSAGARGWPTGSVSAAFAIGVLLASGLWYRGWRHERSQVETLVGNARSASQAANYEAQLVRGTACLWDHSSTSFLAVGSLLSSGESLHLLEGLAEFNFNWSRGGSATLSLEGPAAMMLNNEGMPTLRFGKLTATISARQRPFVLETPIGRLVLRDYGSIGVSAFGNDAEIHVFDGLASLESAWDTPAGASRAPLIIEAGRALRIKAGKNGEVLAERHPAEPSFFVTQTSMASDGLAVSRAYVEAIEQAGPIGYWRMERDAWPRVPNEMGPHLACRVGGWLGRTSHGAGQAVEFGVTDKGGEIIADEYLADQITDSYTLELWIKPSHYHVGAVASLIGKPDTPTGVVPHGMLLELGGSGLIPTAVHHPGRIRFLHRSPASNDSQIGTSCYSAEAYTLRKWQQLAAVKDATTMKLYVNGELAGECEDATQLPAGLRLLIGRLYPDRQVRPFKGQLDEVALYNRALPAKELREHFRLARPQVKAEEPGI